MSACKCTGDKGDAAIICISPTRQGRVLQLQKYEYICIRTYVVKGLKKPMCAVFWITVQILVKTTCTAVKHLNTKALK